MLCFKKVYRDELLQLALLLSILRLNQDSLFDSDIYDGINLDYDNGTIRHQITPSILRSHYINPKSLDSVLFNYERDLFDDLNSLERFSNSFRRPDVTAYLLNIDRTAGPTAGQENLPVALPTPNNQENQTTESVNNAAADDPLVEINLSQEDMDLIEVLWKQDVDLGFSVENATPKPEKAVEIKEEQEKAADKNDDIEKLKTLQAINQDKVKEEPFENDDPWAGINYTVDTETGEYVVKGELLDDNVPGAESGPSCDLSLGDLTLPLPEFFLNDSLQLDETFRLCDLEDETSQETSNLRDLANLSLGANATLTEGDTAGAVSSVSSVEAAGEGVDDSASSSTDAPVKDGEDEFDFLTDMMTPQFHHSHHRGAFQGRNMPFVRAVSMEQRWQDLANLLSLPNPADGGGIHHPFGHHHHLHNYGHPHTMGYGGDSTRGVLLHNATLNPPMGDLNSTVPLSNLGGTNIGNAVATSINLANSSEPMGESSTTPHYKMEPSHDMYYPNGSEINQTDSGLFSSFLNDEDLQLMDMAMNEGMYTMRMLDGNATLNNLGANGTTPMSRNDMERLDSSSDSAVSSMGSERVPSLSDGEWGDAGSDSGHTSIEHYGADSHSKMRPYDYSYSSRQLNSDPTRIPPVAQKKHQMYGKRYFHDHNTTNASHPHTPLKYEYRDSSASSYSLSNQSEGAVGPKINEVKYSCSVEFGLHNQVGRNPIDHIQHNHSYHLSAENTGAIQRPVSRDKGKSRKAEDEHLTRDEKRARALNIPITVDDIINLPMDEFNERLSKYDLSEAQLGLIRDIRRRGKNKVAAQNCRKRKLDQILSLAGEVKEMRDKKLRLINEHDYVKSECKRMKDKYQQLYRHVFQNLRDPDGNQYSPYQYSLQTSADGSILMVPRSNCTNNEQKDQQNQE